MYKYSTEKREKHDIVCINKNWHKINKNNKKEKQIEK